MTDFMDRKKEILVCCCTNNIGCDEESKGEERSRTKCNGNKELKCYNEEYEVFCQRLVATKLGYLEMSD